MPGNNVRTNGIDWLFLVPALDGDITLQRKRASQIENSGNVKTRTRWFPEGTTKVLHGAILLSPCVVRIHINGECQFGMCEENVSVHKYI